jgi:hypothetical protein
MAKIKAQTKSGSVGPSTFQRSRHGLIERQRAQPVDPKTKAQLDHRGFVSAVAGEWRQLTDEQRAGWTALADKLSGELTGINAYNQVNIARAKCGLPTLPTAPALPAFGQLSCAGLWVTDTPRVQLQQVSASAQADQLLIDACRPVSAGISNVSNLFRRLKVVAAPEATPIDLDLTEAYYARFGGLEAGQRVFVHLTLMKDGFQSHPPLQVRALVQADGAQAAASMGTEANKANEGAKSKRPKKRKRARGRA